MILSCDPGLTGALALIDDRTGLLREVADIPTCTNGLASGSMKRWVEVGKLRELLAAIDRVQDPERHQGALL